MGVLGWTRFISVLKGSRLQCPCEIIHCSRKLRKRKSLSHKLFWGSANTYILGRLSSPCCNKKHREETFLHLFDSRTGLRPFSYLLIYVGLAYSIFSQWVSVASLFEILATDIYMLHVNHWYVIFLHTNTMAQEVEKKEDSLIAQIPAHNNYFSSNPHTIPEGDSDSTKSLSNAQSER